MTMMIAILLSGAQVLAPPATLLPATTNTSGTPPMIPVAIQPVRIGQDTPVELMALNEVTTASARPGSIFKLRVNRAIEVNGKVVVPVGTMAFGRVESAVDAGGLGKSGRMTAKLLHIRLGDVEIPLDGDMSAKGTGAGSAGVAFLFSGVLGLFHRGNNAKIKAGEIVSAFVASDVDLDLSSPAAQRFNAPTPLLSPAAL